jgi:catechol 2,3-dioxygenase-like lactoylglutathione lyase family enzyme
MGIGLDGMTPLIQVFDMPRSVAFYRDVLGFEVVASAPPGNEFDWCLLRLDGIELMLNTAYERPERPPEPEATRTETHGDTALFFGCPDIDAALGHLRAKGLRIEPPLTTSYGMKQLHFKDPDGYAVCLQWPAE